MSSPRMTSAIWGVAGVAVGFFVHNLFYSCSDEQHQDEHSQEHYDPDHISKVVLDFWFSSFPSLSHSHRSLWMTSNGTAGQRRADESITEKFLDTVENFDEESWFDSPRPLSPHELTVRFVSAIVLLDQFPRHIHRHKPENSLPPPESTDSLALSIASKFISTDLLTSQFLPTSYFVFSLMPFRHSANAHKAATTDDKLQTLKKVISHVDSRQDLENSHSALLSRFRKATTRRLQTLQDKIRNHNVESSTVEFSEADILEEVGFEGDYDCPAWGKNDLVKSVDKFFSHSDTNNVNSSLGVVSLSGGVDSMVIMDILVALRKKRPAKFGNITLVGIHIDYGNRAESKAESDFVERWCHQRGVEFRVRRVDEVKRGREDRNEYEKKSRDIRYGMYKLVLEEFDCAGTATGVIFGHHIGDVQENVITNSMKGSGPLNLSGMTSSSIINNVLVLRPLLKHTKEEIFQYAQKFGVPYFKDTTPSWSTRGKCRNQLIPLLNDIFGEGFEKNLSHLAFASDAAREMILNEVLQPFNDKVAYYRDTHSFSFDAVAHRGKSEFFWNTALTDLLHSHGLGMIGSEAIRYALKKLNGILEKGKPGSKLALQNEWINMRSDYKVFLRASDGQMFVFNWRYFPKTRKQNSWHTSSVVTAGDKAVSVGAWNIVATYVDDDDSLLAHKPTLEDIISGTFHYYTLISDAAKGVLALPLNNKLHKENKPKAFKGMEVHLTDMIPVFIDEGVRDVCLCNLSNARAEGCEEVKTVKLDYSCKKKYQFE